MMNFCMKTFCTIEYLDEDGHEAIRHAVLSHDEQMKLMEEFINRGIVATIHEHVSDVNSVDEEIEPIEESNSQSQ